MNIRRIALDVLGSWDENEQYINLSITRACDALEEHEKAFFTALVYGTVEHLITLNYYACKLGKRNTFDKTTKDLLCLSLYELHYMHTKEHAVVNEWTNLARNPGEKSLVNAILRTSIREKEQLVPPSKEKNVDRYYSILYSIPYQTVKLLRSILGEELESYLETSSKPSPLTLRVNQNKISRVEYQQLLLQNNIESKETSIAPYGLTLLKNIPPKNLPGFSEGLFFVQDEASQIQTLVLNVQKGDKILDLCACPGGKSFGAAIDGGNQVEVDSFDLHSSKLSLIESGANRLGLSCIQAKEHDGAVFNPSLVCMYDRIICDVPCSGLGVLSKKPDLRYKDFSQCEELIALQKTLLFHASQYLKEGGTLLYSTCSINPKENEEVVNDFMSKNPDYTFLPFTFMGQEVPYLTLYPHIHHTDGFFICRITRKHI